MHEDDFWFEVFEDCRAAINVVLFPGHKSYQNKAIRELFRLEKNSLGKPCYKVIAEKGNPCESCQALEVYQSGEPQIRRREFRGMVLEILISPLIKDGIKIGVVESISDMTPIIEYQEDLRRMAITDPLTGALNRRGMTEIIEEEIIRSQRFGAFSLLMLDVDNLKIINDTQGHCGGDKVLKKIAGILKERLRVTDMVSRFGGDEFVVILPQTKIKNAARLAEKLRKAMRSNAGATVSIGVIQFSPQYNLEKLLTAVDEALYSAKARKNKVVTIR